MKLAWITVIIMAFACIMSGCNKDETAFINYLKDFYAISKQEDCANAASDMRSWIKDNGDAFKVEIKKVKNNRGNTEAAQQLQTMAKDMPTRCDTHIGYLASTARVFELFDSVR